MSAVWASRRAAEERAEALLLAHLTAEQRSEYGRLGTVTVVKRGLVWRTILTYAAFAVGVVALAVIGTTVPGLELAAVVASVAVVTTIVTFLFWLPPLAIACTRRRVWRLSADRKPALVLGSRRIEFCVRVAEDVPRADRLLAFKNAIEGNERYFLRKANALV